MGFEIVPVKWEIRGYRCPHDPPGCENILKPYIESRGPGYGKTDGPDRYAIVYRGDNLNKRTFEWDYEHMPSHRTDQFFKTHRFDSVEEALAVFEKFARVEKRRYDRRLKTRSIKHKPVMFL